jgi:hypothetical protein
MWTRVNLGAGQVRYAVYSAVNSPAKIRTFSAELCYTIGIMKQKARWSPSENRTVAVGSAVGGMIALR